MGWERVGVYIGFWSGCGGCVIGSVVQNRDRHTDAEETQGQGLSRLRPGGPQNKSLGFRV